MTALRRPLQATWTAALSVLMRLRRLVATFIQFAQRDQFRDLREQTQRLGSASVEAATYVQADLQAVEERLARLERELASLRSLLEGGQTSQGSESSDRSDEIVAGPRAS